jgi:beta-glucosidase
MGLAFIEGLRGDDAAHPKAIGCAKHFAVHSGPEGERHHFNSKPSEADLYDTYLPAFEALVREGKVGSVMGAYSAIDGTPCCANPWLLTDLLRKQWGFDGVVFSDGGAIGDIWAEHKFVPGPIEACAAAVKAGCDVSSGGMGQKPDLNAGPGHNNNGIKGGWAFVVAPDAVKKRLLDEAAVTQACERELTMRMKLGLFDPADKDPYAKVGTDQIDSDEHRALALKVAQESIVLLKNDGLLPIAKEKYKKIAVIGPNADAAPMQNGNYAGRASRTTTILQGIKDAAGKGVEVVYEQGSRRTGRKNGADPEPPATAQKAIALAKSSDLIIFVSGIDAGLEKEEASPRDDIYEGFSRGDRTTIELPSTQETLIKSLADTHKRMILVNCSGSAMAMPWENEHLPAIVQAWYPGEEGGRAVAQVLFGEINPAGRLPVTFYASTKDLPPFEDYSMANRTYRYFNGKPLYAFGYGLSYTKFDYTDAKVDHDSIGEGDTLKVSFTLKNTGERDGEDVSQVYFRQPKSSPSQAKLALCGFSRVKVAKGESAQVTLDIPAQRFRTWDTKQKMYVVVPGEYELFIGGASDHATLHAKVTVK